MSEFAGTGPAMTENGSYWQLLSFAGVIGNSDCASATMRLAMTDTASARPRWATTAAVIAIAFGLVTIAVGGRTLFGGPAVRAASGNIVPFVLWFNFLAGFAYAIAGVGLLCWKRWAALLSAAIAIATLVVFVAFGVHVLLGGAFEPRTAGAMTFRSLVWIVIAVAACRALGCFSARQARL